MNTDGRQLYKYKWPPPALRTCVMKLNMQAANTKGPRTWLSTEVVAMVGWANTRQPAFQEREEATAAVVGFGSCKHQDPSKGTCSANICCTSLHLLRPKCVQLQQCNLQDADTGSNFFFFCYVVALFTCYIAHPRFSADAVLKAQEKKGKVGEPSITCAGQTCCWRGMIAKKLLLHTVWPLVETFNWHVAYMWVYNSAEMPHWESQQNE